MIVPSLSNCPPKLRGDLSKWLVEINAGVYVGRVSARVRDELWQRVCENLRDGRATMVFRANTEQGLDFRVHNTTWIPVDYDGIQLMLRPMEGARMENGSLPPSRAAQRQMVQAIRQAAARKAQREGYYVVDIETTGLRADQHEILEIAALHIVGQQVAEQFETLVHIRGPLPAAISELTGIREETLREEGVELEEAMRRFLSFVGDGQVVCHNAGFDYAFLKSACRKCHLPEFKNRYSDTLQLAKQRLESIIDYKLTTLATHFGMDVSGAHRALADCYLTFAVFEKLKELDA